MLATAAHIAAFVALVLSVVVILLCLNPWTKP